MPLAEAGRFATLLEAEVACAALNANGVSAQVFDRHYAGNVWISQVALSGVRVMTSVDDLPAARQFLQQVRASDPAALKWGHARGAYAGAPLALLAAWLGLAGWILAAARQRPTPLRLGLAALLLAVIALFLAAAWHVDPGG